MAASGGFQQGSTELLGTFLDACLGDVSKPLIVVL